MADRVHTFSIFPQSYNYGCWLASTHSILMYDTYQGYYTGGLTYPVSLFGENIVQYNDSWLGENWGLLMESNILTAFASANNLSYQQLNGNTTPIKSQISRTPVMVAGNITGVGIHFFVVTGIKGDTVYYADPMPVGRGSTGKTTFAAFKQRHPGAFQHAFWK